MKTIEQIKEEYIKQYRFNSWGHFLNQGVITDKDVTEIATRYASQSQAPTDLLTTEISVMQERIAELEELLIKCYIDFKDFSKVSGSDHALLFEIESLINKGK